MAQPLTVQQNIRTLKEEMTTSLVEATYEVLESLIVPMAREAAKRRIRQFIGQQIIDIRTKSTETIDLDTLPKIIKAIQDGTIDYGQGKTYYLFLDEDGDLTFLKRIPDEERDKDFEPEDLAQWPLNERDGEVIWSTYCGEHRGTTIASSLLRCMNIECGGV